MTRASYQDLSLFKVPESFRGKSGWYVQLWWIIRDVFFRNSPQFMYGWRAFLLKAFGAKIGKQVIIRPSVIVTYPWFLTVGDHAWIGDNTELYNLAPIEIGAHAVVSQGCYLCTGTHDYEKMDFPIRVDPIRIGAQVWLATQVFVMPGVEIGEGSVVGARSMVTKSVPSGMVCMGTPARIIRRRLASEAYE